MCNPDQEPLNPSLAVALGAVLETRTQTPAGSISTHYLPQVKGNGHYQNHFEEVTAVQLSPTLPPPKLS